MGAPLAHRGHLARAQGRSILTSDAPRPPNRNLDGTEPTSYHAARIDSMALTWRTPMMRRPLVPCLLAAAAALLVAMPALAQKPVKIGVLTPLSPPGDASAGQFIVRGAKMAADEVNARGGVLGGRKIELVVEDDSGTPEKGAAGFRKLASQDQVVAVMGQFHSSVMAAVQSLAEQYKIPVFATQASAPRHHREPHAVHVPDPRDRPGPRRALEPLDQAAGLQASGDHRREHGLWRGARRGNEEAVQDHGRAGRAEDGGLRPCRGRPDPPAPRHQELEAGPGPERRRGHARVPDREAGVRHRPVPVGADADLLRPARPARVLEEPRRQGRLSSRSSSTTTRR